jgi:N6-adenosine-specific RNA methylase IME4
LRLCCWPDAPTRRAARKAAEICLLFKRGNLDRRSKSVRQLIIAPIREPSRKPDEAYARIEQLVGGPYLELFSRSTRPGWDVWGDQVGMFNGHRLDTGLFHPASDRAQQPAPSAVSAKA